MFFLCNCSIGICCPSSCILRDSQERRRADISTGQQDDRGVEPEQWKRERISCLDLDVFCFLFIQEFLQSQLGDPDSRSTENSLTNIFKKDMHKININEGKLWMGFY